MNRRCAACRGPVPAHRASAGTCSIACTGRLALRGDRAAAKPKRRTKERPRRQVAAAVEELSPPPTATTEESSSLAVQTPVRPRLWSLDEVFRAAGEEAPRGAGDGAPELSAAPGAFEAREAEPPPAASEAPRVCTECGEPAVPGRSTCSDACQASARRRGTSVAAEQKRRRTQAAEVERVRAEGKPFPSVAETALSVERVDREQDCTHYGDCLDLAANLDWPGWSCGECPIRGTCNREPEAPRGASIALMALEDLT